jgi:hypothetical protein
MIEIFDDRRDKYANDRFQAWRRNNPDGFLLNPKSPTKYQLHSVDCRHLGDSANTRDDYDESLTAKPKDCSLGVEELERWAEERGAAVIGYSHCIEYEAE